MAESRPKSRGIVVKPTKGGAISDGAMSEIKNALDRGGVVVYPTDTLYALGCKATSESALERLFALKKRPSGMPLSVAVFDIRMMRSVAQVDERAERIAKAFLPGPLTLILRKQDGLPEALTGGSDTIGVRIPAHDCALSLIMRAGPLTATSANVHSGESPCTIDGPQKSFKGGVDFYIDCGETPLGVQSTIIDASGEELKLVREGAIPFHAVKDMC